MIKDAPGRFDFEPFPDFRDGGGIAVNSTPETAKIGFGRLPQGVLDY
jgi:hypothetical protein